MFTSPPSATATSTRSSGAVVLPPTATEILTGILARDEAQQSAASVGRDLDDPGRLLRDAVGSIRTRSASSPNTSSTTRSAASVQRWISGRSLSHLTRPPYWTGASHRPAAPSAVRCPGYPASRARLVDCEQSGPYPTNRGQRVAGGRSLDRRATTQARSQIVAPQRAAPSTRPTHSHGDRRANSIASRLLDTLAKVSYKLHLAVAGLVSSDDGAVSLAANRRGSRRRRSRRAVAF